MSIGSRIAALAAEIRRFELDRIVWQIGFLIVMPLLMAVAGAFTPDIYHYHKPVAFILWGLIGAAFIAFAIRANPSVKSLLAVLQENEQLTEENTRFSQTIFNLTQAIELSARQSTVIFATRKMVVEYVRQGIPDRTRLREALSELLSPLYLEGESFFGIGGSERWNFAVYMWSANQNSLVPVWREKARNHPSAGDGRVWPRGEGHIGRAFIDKQPIITRDTQNPDAQIFTGVSEPLRRDYDSQVYRSFASVPIMSPAGDAQEPLGILAATSDRVGRFDRENTVILAHMADVMGAMFVLGQIRVDDLQ